ERALSQCPPHAGPPAARISFPVVDNSFRERKAMRVVPVLDLKGGHVVRGVGGRREEYRPVVSRLTDSSVPVDVATAFRDHLGLSEVYVADLDAIAGAGPALETYAALRDLGCTLWVD